MSVAGTYPVFLIPKVFCKDAIISVESKQNETRKTRLDLCYQLLLRKKWRNQISNTAGVVRLAFRKLYETGFFHLGKIKCWDLDLQSLPS